MKRLGEKPMTDAERQARVRAQRAEWKRALERIALSKSHKEATRIAREVLGDATPRTPDPLQA